MNRSLLPLAMRLLALTCLLAVPTMAPAVTSGVFSMEVLVDGVPLEEFATRDARYIEALEGREYAVRLRNRTGDRIAVALSVDGLNSIDARSTNPRAASKWILGPYETVTIEGWQTGASTARRFFFTTEQRSYGAWLGETSNLGVIAAAVFHEKQPPVVKPAPIVRPGRRDDASAPRSKRQRAAEGGRAGDAAAPAPPESMRFEESESLAPPSDDLAATGIGERIDHSVRQVRFRSESRPAVTMQLRYEYRDGLIALGVLPRPWPGDRSLERRERARGFEGLDFAPDPYR